MPKVRRILKKIEAEVEAARFSVACIAPAAIRPRPQKITMAITAHCNLRCQGCRYGRDFMPGSVLPYPVILGALEDAAAAGIQTIRLYGGEPLLHPDLPRIVRATLALGIKPYVTTNGVLLDRRVDALFDAGLRDITVGFYGTGDDYDDYVQRPGRFSRLENSIAAVRRQYGASIRLQLNYLLSRRSCSIEALQAAWSFAERFDMQFHTDLIHYSLPYFSEGPDQCLQFRQEDKERIYEVVQYLLRLKAASPDRLKEPVQSLVSIPDWLLKGDQMRIPCDVEKLIWIGADGTVQLCYVTFKLGNLHQMRLRDMLFTPKHAAAARGAYTLDCPNCHCERAARVTKHLPSRLRYRRLPTEQGTDKVPRTSHTLRPS